MALELAKARANEPGHDDERDEECANERVWATGEQKRAREKERGRVRANEEEPERETEREQEHEKEQEREWESEVGPE